MKIKLSLAIIATSILFSFSDHKVYLIYRSCTRDIGVYDLYDGPGGNGSFLGSAKGPCCKMETLADGTRGAIIQIGKNTKLAKEIKKLDPGFDLNYARVYPRKSNNTFSNLE